METPLEVAVGLERPAHAPVDFRPPAVQKALVPPRRMASFISVNPSSDVTIWETTRERNARGHDYEGSIALAFLRSLAAPS